VAADASAAAMASVQCATVVHNGFSTITWIGVASTSSNT